MNDMFASCTSLTSLDLSTFKTNKVSNMSAMFYEDQNLLELDMRNFDSSNCNHFESMFEKAYENITVVIDKNKCSNMIKYLPENAQYKESLF